MGPVRLQEYILLSTHEVRKQCVTPLSLVLFLLGCAWVSLLGTICVTTGELKPRGTYVSDNAIMPGTAMTEVTASDLEDTTGGNFQDLVGVEPLGFNGLKGGLFRSSFASDRREAICVVAQENRGDDVLLALAKSLHRATWLSKDVLFVVLPEHESFRNRSASSLRSYLEAYSLGPLDDGLARTGPIRGAVVVDLPQVGGRKGEPALNREALLVQGMNGRLPNMDMINTARLTVPTFATGRQSFFESEHEDRTSIESKSLKGIKFARDILLGPTGWHGEFLRLGIDAITIRASVTAQSLPATTSSRVLHAASQVAGGTRVEYVQRIEKMVRSLSNISEKLNRSFYFYVMLGVDSFVSIDEFLWALILLLSPLCVEAIYVAAAPNACGFRDTRAALSSLSRAIMAAFVVFLFAKEIQARWKLPLGVQWITSLAAFLLAETVCVPGTSCCQNAEFQPWRYQKAANEVFVFILSAALGVIHFPLALCTAWTCLPAVRIACPLTLQPSRHAIGSFLSLLTLMGTTVWLFWQPFYPLNEILMETNDMKAIVLFLVVLPSHMMTLSVLWPR